MMMEHLETLSTMLEQQADKSKAIGMEKYMKDNFMYLGVSSVPRKVIFRQWNSVLPKDLSAIQRWDVVRELWEKEAREYQYIAVDWVNSWPNSWLIASDISEIKFILENKSWWDSVDLLASNILGKYAKKFPAEMDLVVESWQEETSIWLHRSCLIYQLKYKDTVDLERLSYLIACYKSNKTFFIQKAIGWSLREVSKWNPDWVRKTVGFHELKGLAFREAMKYVK